MDFNTYISSSSEDRLQNFLNTLSITNRTRVLCELEES